MQILEQAYQSLPKLIPVLLVIVGLIVALRIISWFLLGRRNDLGSERKIPRQLLMLFLTVVALLCVIIILPVEPETRGQLLSLVGLVLTAVIGLSSTSFVTNAMAGLMLRAIKSFSPGDFVRVGEQFGRITERGLFHTEIQTVDSDLTTIPNLYLVTNPLTVLRSSGTIVSATVSLGYDVDHSVVRPLLAEAAESARLEDPFVHVMELGDYSVTYRVAGLLAETKNLLATRSRLRQEMLDYLHLHDIEIVSPMFMNRRFIPPGVDVIPRAGSRATDPNRNDEDLTPKTYVFDKADKAEKIERLRKRLNEMNAEIKIHEADKSGADPDEQVELTTLIKRKQARIKALESTIKRAEQENQSS